MKTKEEFVFECVKAAYPGWISPDEIASRRSKTMSRNDVTRFVSFHKDRIESRTAGTGKEYRWILGADEE